MTARGLFAATSSAIAVLITRGSPDGDFDGADSIVEATQFHSDLGTIGLRI